MDNIEFLSRYSFMPNKLGYCGPSNISDLIQEYISGKDSFVGEQILNSLSKFEALGAYLRLIAEKNEMHWFDYRVAEAYWIGNELLENVYAKDIRNLILNKFSKPEFLGSEISAKLVEKVPENVTAHHSFHVFNINSLTKKVPTVIENLDKCKISWGEVLRGRANTLEISYTPIVLENEKFVFGNDTKKQIRNYFGDEIVQGDMISFHWESFCEKLNTKKLETLKKVTINNLEAIN
ncbi:MAG: DUF6390 family protein [Candidatus Diapherotrites archaeon]